jgi:hypothetical protein
MLSQRHDGRHLENQGAPAAAIARKKSMAEAAEPALRWIITDEEVSGRQSAPECGAKRNPWAGPDQACKFIRGLSIALPLSISLWIFMIWGIKAIW